MWCRMLCPVPQDTACLDALENVQNPFWIGDQPAGTEVSGSGMAVRSYPVQAVDGTIQLTA